MKRDDTNTLLSRLQGVQRSGSGWVARCPGHDDHTPSLSIAEGRDGMVLVKCFAGCKFDDILKAINLAPSDLCSNNGRRVVGVYDYRDEEGHLLSQVVRYEPKSFRQRRPDGNGGWLWSIDGVRRTLYRLPELKGRRTIFIAEGEKGVDSLWSVGLPATCSPGGAGKWHPEFAEQLKALVEETIIHPDNDPPGQNHAISVARSCLAVGLKVKILRLDGLPDKGDIVDWLDRGGTREELLKLVEQAPLVGVQELRPEERTRDPWAQAQSAADFISAEEPEVTWLEENLLAPGSITEIFSPRGIGKTHVAHALAVKLARQGKRGLLLDRDNSRREVRRRLGGWGAAEVDTLKVLARDQAPPLTDKVAWAAFPYQEYDIIIIDSLDASAEGVGEKDSAKPSQAIAPILDLARREHGPAILVLGNTIKSGEHGRGSGIIQDRADIVYEVRDVTGLHPTGKKKWWLELPQDGAADWGERAGRRKRRSTYRLAFISTKFRVGEEPEPFILEIDLSSEPWTLRDVTSEVVQVGETTLAEAETRREEKRAEAAKALVAEIRNRERAGEVMLVDKDAIPFLRGQGLTQAQARQLIKEGEAKTKWHQESLKKRPGRPKALKLCNFSIAVKKDPGDGNTPSQTPHPLLSETGVFPLTALDAGHGNTSPQGRASGGDSEAVFPLKTPFLHPGEGKKRPTRQALTEIDNAQTSGSTTGTLGRPG